MQLHGNWILAVFATAQRSYYQRIKAALPSQHLDHKQVSPHLLLKDFVSSFLGMEWNSRWRCGFGLPAQNLNPSEGCVYVWPTPSVYFPPGKNEKNMPVTRCQQQWEIHSNSLRQIQTIVEVYIDLTGLWNGRKGSKSSLAKKYRRKYFL